MIAVKSSVVVIAFLAATLAIPAAGRSQTQPPTESARAHYQRGKTHYQLAEYKEALEEFRAAYRVKQDAVFLFNIAQCHRQLDQHGEAIKLYGAYLRESPNAPNRAEVEKLITELKQEQELERKKLEEQDKKKAEEAAAAAAAERQRLEDERKKAEEAAAAAATERQRLEDERKKAEAQAGGAKQPPVGLATTPARPTTGELEVVATQPDAIVLLNRMQVGTGAATRVRLPPGLYTVTVQKDGYRAAEVGASLFGGERTRIETDLQRLKSHGWRHLGHLLVVLALASEAGGIVARVKGQNEFEGSAAFNSAARAEKLFQAGAITFGTLAIGSYVLDWYRNRNRADDGPPALITNVSRGAL